MIKIQSRKLFYLLGVIILCFMMFSSKNVSAEEMLPPEKNVITNFPGELSFLSSDGKSALMEKVFQTSKGVNEFTLYDIETGQIKEGFTLPKNPNGYNEHLLSPDGRFLISIGDLKTQVYRMDTKELLYEFPEHKGPYVFHKNGSLLAIQNIEYNNTYVVVYNLDTGKKLFTYKTPDQVGASIIFHPSEEILILATEEKLTFLDARTGAVLFTKSSRYIHNFSMAFSPSHEKLMVGGYMFDATNNYELISPYNFFQSSPSLGHVKDIIFHPTGKYIITRSESTTICVYDAYTGELLVELPEYKNVSMSEDGKWLLLDKTHTYGANLIDFDTLLSERIVAIEISPKISSLYVGEEVPLHVIGTRADGITGKLPIGGWYFRLNHANQFHIISKVVQPNVFQPYLQGKYPGIETTTLTASYKYLKVQQELKIKLPKPTVENVYNSSYYLRGTAIPNTTVKYKYAEKTYAGEANNDGYFQIYIEDQLPSLSTLEVWQEENGLESQVVTVDVQNDTIVPNQPSVNIVNDLNRTVYGKAEPDSTISISHNGQTYSTKVAPSGTYRYVLPKVIAGKIVELEAKDRAGNSSDSTKIKALDKTSPSPPQVNTVYYNHKIVTGKAEPYSFILVKRGSAKLGTGKATSKGSYRVLIKSQKKKTKITITAKDKSGNMSKARTITIR